MRETRGVWIHDSTCRTVGGAKVADVCHGLGLNMLLPKVPWLTGPKADPGYWREVMDPMIRRAHQLDMEVHAWIFFLDSASIDEDQSLMQVLESGKVEKLGCPANPETVKRNLDKIGPVLEEHDLDGFSLEDCFVYHRWPKDPLICFCDYCKDRAPSEREERMRWNKEQLTKMLAAIVKESGKHSSRLRISAAARVPYESHSLPMSADWREWCEMGLLDFLAPMIYERSEDKLEGIAVETLELVGASRVPVYVGLGAYILDRELTGHDVPQQLARQISIVRRLSAPGHILYHLGALTVDQSACMASAYGLGQATA